jgi:ankyrin repeat protein
MKYEKPNTNAKFALGDIESFSDAFNAEKTIDPVKVLAFFQAVQQNDIAKIDDLLWKHVSIDETISITDITTGYTYENATPLHLVAAKGYYELVERFIREGQDRGLINKQTTDGRTPLHFAALNGNKKVFDLLVQRGAKTDIKDKDGKTASDLLANPINSFLKAAKEGDKRTIIEMLNKGIDINCSIDELQSKEVAKFSYNHINATALHHAAANGHNDLVQYLIRKGATLEATTIEGRTPLHFAAAKGQLTTATTLVEKGADAQAIDNKKKKPLDLAKDASNNHFVKVFENIAADNNKQLKASPQLKAMFNNKKTNEPTNEQPQRRGITRTGHITINREPLLEEMLGVTTKERFGAFKQKPIEPKPLLTTENNTNSKHESSHESSGRAK